MTNLSISLLGTYQAAMNGASLLPLPTNKAQALLSYLVAERVFAPGTPPRRETVMALLWPGMPDKSARQNLRQALYLLRQTIPEVSGQEGPIPFLLSDYHTITINPEARYQLDLAAFLELAGDGAPAALAEAVDLYRGDFLQDFYMEDSSEYEAWAANHRARLRLQVLDNLELLAGYYLAQGDYERAEAYARSQIALDPLREESHRQLVEALARSGRRSAALAAYDELVNLLERDLGVPPALITQELVAQIRAGTVQATPHGSGHIRGYQLQEQIGQGSFGIVYRAIQPAVGREVAVKAIRRRYANDPDFIRRFETEAQLVARLEHPHIVPLYDYWREPGGAYLVMRLMRGGSLKDRLADGGWPLEKVVPLLEEVASAMDLAHQRGVIHLDIKPANILLDEAGRAYLTDFGIAKEWTSGHESGEGIIAGTPKYMAPEQVTGQKLNPQTDIYSLGLVLYEMLTGQQPLAETPTGLVLVKRLSEPLPLLRELQPDLPPVAEAVVQKATALEPGERYATAAALAAALRQAVESEKAAYPTFIPQRREVPNPYLGLRAFSEAEAERFYGREKLTEQLLAALQASHFLVMVGPSGSGKSSVVRAGLLPALRGGALPDSEQWFITDMIPGAHPYEELEAALLRVAVNPPPTLLKQLQEDERGLVRAAKRLLPDREGTLVLVVDQFEELYTLVGDADTRRRFLEMLQAAADPAGQVRVVLTLRADFYDRPLGTQAFGELVKNHTVAIVPPTKEELARAIRLPAEQAGAGVEEALMSSLVRDVYDQPGALPLLQYALTELFARREQQFMTQRDYERIGGVQGALANRAEALYQELDDTQKRLARQLFLRLVAVGEGAEDTRRRVLRSELETLLAEDTAENGDGHGSRAALAVIIDRFGRHRLITFDNDPATREPTVEVAHEALLYAWPRFQAWIETGRDDLRQQRRLTRWAQEWEDSGRNLGLLLRGARLDQMAGWAAQTDLALSGSEADLLQASMAARQEREAAEEARRQRELETAQRLAEEEKARAEEQSAAAHNLRRRAVYLGLALVVAVVLAIAAGIFSRQSAQNADLAATGEAQALTNLELAQTREAEANQAANERATAQAEAEVEAQARAAAQAEAEQSELAAVAAGATAQAEAVIRATAEGEAVQRQLEAEAEARIAFARELAAGAITNLELDPDLSLLLALEAVNTTYTRDGVVVKEAESALHQAVSNTQRELTLVGGNDDDWAVGITYSPDGKYLAIGYDLSGTVIIWDGTTGQELLTFQTDHTDYLEGMAFSPDGTRIVTSSDDGTAKVWDTNTGQELLTLSGHTDWVYWPTFSSDGTRIATVSTDGTAKVWDAATGQELLSLTTHVGTAGGVAFSPDGKRIVTDGEDVVIVWDAISGEALLTLPCDEVGYVAYSPDGKLFSAVCGHQDSAIVWDAASGQELFKTPNVGVGAGGNLIDFSPDGSLLAVKHADGKIRLWDTASGQAVSTLVCDLAAKFIDFSPDGTHIAINAGNNNIARVCALMPKGEWLTVSSFRDRGYGVAFSPDGTRLAATSGDDTAKIVDIFTGQELFTLVTEGDSLYDIAYNPAGTRLVTAGRGTPKVWDAASGQELLSLGGHTDYIWTVAFSPDGSKIATASADETARVWDAATGQELLVLDDHNDRLLEVAFSPDGNLLATSSSDGIVKIRDAVTGEALLTLESGSSAFGLAFSPDGSLFAAANNVGTVNVWDVPNSLATGSGQEVISFEKPDNFFGLAFSPDGENLVTVGGADVATIWDVDTGEELLTLGGHTNTVWDVAFSPDGTKLATASWDGTARVYVLPIEDLLALAYERVTRWWTPAECQRYLHQDVCPPPPGKSKVNARMWVDP